MANLFPATQGRELHWFNNEALVLPAGRFVSAIGVCDITTTPANVFDIKFRNRYRGKPDLVGLTVPAGAVICFMGFKFIGTNYQQSAPRQSIVSTATNRLKLATAVGATGTQAFNASASTAYVESAGFSANSLPTDESTFQVSPWGTSAPLTSATTFRLFVTDGANAAGSNISVSRGQAYIMAGVRFWLPSTMPPDLNSIDGYPALLPES